jgi:predicted small secreted protein
LKRFSEEDSAMRKTLFGMLFSTLLVLTSAAGLTACSTIEGAGKDIEKAGAAIKDAARK